MASINKANGPLVVTHEGAPARIITPEQELRRTVMACLLWEDSFYESGTSVVDRIRELIPKVDPEAVAKMARIARTDMNLRHVPLMIVRQMLTASVQHRLLVGDTLEYIIQRPDELGEFLAIYYADNKDAPLAAQAKIGLARAFTKFNEYNLAKYNNQEKAWKLRDVLFMVHPKPKNEEQQAIWNKLVEGKLETPDTWEVALSGGEDKKETFTRLLKEGKLGALALLRNLRNMQGAGVDDELIKESLGKMKTERVLPFRFLSAARYAPKLEPELEAAMFRSLTEVEKLPGRTILLVDGSGSMFGTKVSSKSEIDRFEAACALSILAREICQAVGVIVFGSSPRMVPPRRGFALRDALTSAADQGGTHTELAKRMADEEGYDRIIIFTDEQSHEALSNPKGRGYVVNVAGYRNGIGYGQWVHIDGFSEAIIRYIQEYEKL